MNKSILKEAKKERSQSLFKIIIAFLIGVFFIFLGILAICLVMLYI